MPLVLASASPRRAALLEAAAIPFVVVAVDVDETPLPGESPRDYVLRLAVAKARAGAQKIRSGRISISATSGRPDSPTDGRVFLATAPHEGAGGGALLPAGPVVLGADTTVVVDGEILGKPDDREHAVDMLRKLSGRTHEVLTGVALVRDETLLTGIERTLVRFVAMNEDEIAWYADSGEPLGKAGGYAIQGLASRFVDRVEGSYTNVVGLPVPLIYQLLRQLGPRSSHLRRSDRPLQTGRQ